LSQESKIGDIEGGNIFLQMFVVGKVVEYRCMILKHVDIISDGNMTHDQLRAHYSNFRLHMRKSGRNVKLAYGKGSDR
jgi:hypothetical protein